MGGIRSMDHWNKAVENQRKSISKLYSSVFTGTRSRKNHRPCWQRGGLDFVNSKTCVGTYYTVFSQGLFVGEEKEMY